MSAGGILIGCRLREQPAGDLGVGDALDAEREGGEAAAELEFALLKLHRRKWLRLNPSGTNAQYIAALEADDWEI